METSIGGARWGARRGARWGSLGAGGQRGPGTGELFNDLGRFGPLRVEHIVSSDSPDTRMQCQHHDEWVMVISGSAILQVQGEEWALAERDWVWLPAGTEHRVTQTESGTEWLAVHIGEPAEVQDL